MDQDAGKDRSPPNKIPDFFLPVKQKQENSDTEQNAHRQKSCTDIGRRKKELQPFIAKIIKHDFLSIQEVEIIV